MPSKRNAVKAAMAAVPSIPKELIDQFVTGPMGAEAVDAASVAFKKALNKRALGAELGHHLGYESGDAKPDAAANHRKRARLLSFLSADRTRNRRPESDDRVGGTAQTVLDPEGKRGSIWAQINIGEIMSARGKVALGIALAIGFFIASIPAAVAAPKIKIGNVSMAYTLYVDMLPALAKEEGLDVEVIDFKSSSDENLALATGSLDGGNVGALGTNSLLTKGVPVVIVAGTVRGGSGFVVGKSIQSLQELQGKKVGATKGSTSEMLAKYQLKKAGISVTWVNLPHSQLGVALSQNEVVAMAAGEPWASLAVSRGIGKILPGFNIYDSPAGKISGAFVVSQKLVHDDPVSVQKLVNALVKAVRLAETQREDYIRHAVTKLNVSDEEVRIALKNADITYQIYPGEWPALTGIAKDMGYVQESADYSKAFDLKFLENAVK